MRGVTIFSLMVVILGFWVGIVTAAAPGPFGGLAQPTCVSLGLLIALTFVPADTIQTALIKRWER